jgi:hypothetical protein
MVNNVVIEISIEYITPKINLMIQQCKPNPPNELHHMKESTFKDPHQMRCDLYSSVSLC